MGSGLDWPSVDVGNGAKRQDLSGLARRGDERAECKGESAKGESMSEGGKS